MWRIGRIGGMGRVTVPGRVCGEVDAWGAGMGRKSADRGERLVIGSGASRAIHLNHACPMQELRDECFHCRFGGLHGRS